MDNQVTITQAQLKEIVALLGENYKNLKRLAEILAEVTEGQGE